MIEMCQSYHWNLFNSYEPDKLSLHHIFFPFGRKKGRWGVRKRRKILFRGLSKSTKKANFLLTTLTSWSESIILRERRIDSVWNILNRSIGNFDKCPFWRKLKLFIEVEDKLIFLLPSGKRKRLSVAKVKVELDDAQLGHSTSFAPWIRTC